LPAGFRDAIVHESGFKRIFRKRKRKREKKRELDGEDPPMKFRTRRRERISTSVEIDGRY
jgi:hypothetical protein